MSTTDLKKIYMYSWEHVMQYENNKNIIIDVFANFYLF